MKITCRNCFAVYTVDETKISEPELKVRCSKCNYSFIVRLKGPEETVPPEEPKVKREELNSENDAENSQLFVRLASGQSYQVDDYDTLKKWIAENRVTAEDELSISGDRWQRIGDLTDFREIFGLAEEEGSEPTIYQNAVPEPPPPQANSKSQAVKDVAGLTRVKNTASKRTQNPLPPKEKKEPTFRPGPQQLGTQAGKDNWTAAQTQHMAGPNVSLGFDTDMPTYQGSMQFPGQPSLTEHNRPFSKPEDTYVEAKKAMKKIGSRRRPNFKVTIPLFVGLLFIAFAVTNPAQVKNIIRLAKQTSTRLVSLASEQGKKSPAKKSPADKVVNANDEQATTAPSLDSSPLAATTPSYFEKPNYIKAVRLIKFDTVSAYEIGENELVKLMYSFDDYALYGLLAKDLALLGYRTADAKLLTKALEFATLNLSKPEADKNDAYQAMALYYIAKDSTPRGIKLTEDFLNKIADQKSVDYIWGLHYRKQKIITQAEERFKSASQADPDHMLPRRELSDIAKSQKEEGRALALNQEIEVTLKRLKQDYPDLEADLVKKELPPAPAVVEKPKKVASAKSVKKKETPPPKEKEAGLSHEEMFNKGKALLAKSENQKASEHFEIAIMKRPSNYMYHYYYGLALQELYQTDRAVTAYKKAISINPSYAPPYKKLGLLYMQFGENLKARITLKKYMAIAPTASDIPQVKNLVDEIQ